ncbi:MAG: PP2C family protein-serine/threonine phosphatase, partial [Lachnospiraceae bacterium]
VLNIGDSRAYHFNNEALIQITKDHTEGQRMLDLGLLTRKELSGFPARKNLNRYIGYGQSGYVLRADEYYPVLEDGIILLCSDGISDFLSDTRISEILCSENNLEIAGKQLINEAVSSHNADNATAILIPLRR